MKIIEPSYKIILHQSPEYIIKHLEYCGRISYRSDMSDNSAEKFLRARILSGHESILEHFSFSVEFTINRSVALELVRHRLASYTMESQRYVNYGKDKFGGSITFIKPLYWNSNTDKYEKWQKLQFACEQTYLSLLHDGAKPEESRGVLTNDVACLIMATANIREWRHILKLRTHKSAHPQMRQIMQPLCKELQFLIPCLFDDIQY